jgi:polysaccharide export outer membrane protein
MTRKHLRFIVIFPLMLPAIARPQASAPIPLTTPASTAKSVQPPPDYRLNLSDTLDIQMPFSPEYNETTTVQPDGRISLREAQPIQVSGKTVPEVEALIVQAYAGVLNKPQVSILLKDFLKPSYYASGEIGRPGRYELRSNVTLLQALSEAGGMLNERASKKEVVIFRPQGNGTFEPHVVDVKNLLSAKAAHEDYPILPGDIIYVPQNRMSKIQKYIPTANMGMGAYLTPAAF